MSSRTALHLAKRDLLAGSGIPGPGQRRARSDLSDQLLQGLLADHLGGHPAGVALVAVGGYGRASLSPGSDLDVVVLHSADVDLTGLTTAVLYPLWDAGIPLDHSVRTVEEARAVAREDLRAALGLLNLRHVAGAEGLTSQLRAQTLQDWRSGARGRLPELRQMSRDRTRLHGELAYLLEPDLKESSGGLRDVVSLRAVAASWVADVPHHTLDRAEQVLLDTRDALHAARRRPTDRLLMQEQDRVAAELRLPDADALMQTVAQAARDITYAGDLTWRMVDRALPPAPRSRVLAPVRALRRSRGPLPARMLADGVAEQGGEAVLTAQVVPEHDPELVLRLAATAAEQAIPISPASLDRLAAESGPLPDPWSDQQRNWFVRLLGAGGGLPAVWESLDQAGLVVRLLPEWGPLRSRPQRNALHRFTVDRHLVETAVQASLLATRVHRPDLLLVAAVLHDVGKALPGDHSEAGVPVVREVARRMGFPAGDVNLLVMLVRHHLLLPAMATSRDLQDPATVAAVVDAIGATGAICDIGDIGATGATGDIETLHLLHALTEADARAAGPTAWTPWRAGLVRKLVAAVERAAGEHEPGSRRKEEPVPAVAPVPATAANGLSAAGGMGRIVAQPLPQGLSVDLGAVTDATLPLRVVALDQPGLLALVAGVLTVRRLTVRSARTSSVGPLAVMEFAVGADHGSLPDLAVLREELLRALDGTVDVAARVARRVEAYAVRPSTPVAPPEARVVPDASAAATVLEVRAHDRPGLVHLVASALTAAGVDVRSAIVSTLGAEAVDAFYLVDPEGRPLSPTRAEEVARVVEAALGQDVAAGRRIS